MHTYSQYYVYIHMYISNGVMPHGVIMPLQEEEIIEQKLQCQAWGTTLQVVVWGILETTEKCRVLPLPIVASQNLKVRHYYGRLQMFQTQDLE